MAGMVIDAHVMTDEFENTMDSYIYDPAPFVGMSGDGTPVVLPYATLTMHWPIISDDEMDNILTDILDGGDFKACTGTLKLYDHTKTLQTLTSCKVYRPIPKGFSYGYHHDVTLRITEIV